MADGKRYAPNQQLDIQQILVEAQHRWLRPAEICEILRNYRKFYIAPEPPNKPPSGSLFLFDRKVLRYFRKDGHNWRKKKDGKTVKEAHERLKAESIDVLHCYYAHGEENESFQRRTYWMLEEAFMHIVLVHYLEVKGAKSSYSRSRDDNDIARVGQLDSPLCSNSFTSQDQLTSQNTDAGSPNSAQTSEYEDAQSDNYQARSRYHSFLGLQQYENGHLMDAHLLNSNIPLSFLINQYDNQIPQALTPETDLYSASRESLTKAFDGRGLGLGYSVSRTQLDLPGWDEVLENTATRFPSASITASLETESAAIGNISKQVTYTLGELLPDEVNVKQQDNMKGVRQVCDPDVNSFASSKEDAKSELSLEGNVDSAIVLKQSTLGLSNVEGEGLKKFDSFSKWMSKTLSEVDDSNMKSNAQGYWNFMESERVDDSGMSNPEQDAFIVGPSVSQDQLFSIIDFSPNWAYNDVETKVLITGIFLKAKKDIEHLKLSCMFGEVEVPAEILADGILRCHAPPHTSGRVPFYITCSNRLACSEVREFEYRVNHAESLEISDLSTCGANEMHLHIRLGKLLSLGPINQLSISSDDSEKGQMRNKISSLLMEADDKWFNMLKYDKELSPDRVKDQLLQKLLKEKLHDWLIQKIAEDGRGPNILDKDGQGAIHLTAALGYDWAIKPIITAGVSIDFRDARGWTALHWAASCGRERTVVSLVTLGAATGALTDPTPDFPSGRTPADLASGNGHKGIAGFLAESSLTSHLSILTLKDDRGINLTDVSGVEDIDKLEEQSGIQLLDGDVEAGLSLKESLCAVRNAALAAARIHQVFRVDSFQRKRIVEYSDDQCGISDEQALSLVSLKTCKPGLHDMPVHAAAIRIQNKYRGWKGRKEFLITRQRIVKIQAHVRGHQVRKRYKKIVFTVGIWEKAVLRWKRKGCGLRGFRSAVTEGTSMQIEPAKEDDYDFLIEGRRQTEARLDKALARVKSMVQYPEARDQYRRLLTVVTELQESKVMEENILNEFMDVTEESFHGCD